MVDGDELGITKDKGIYFFNFFNGIYQIMEDFYLWYNKDDTFMTTTTKFYKIP